MSHYVCTGGCGGVADAPGSCHAEDCKNYQEPLAPCDCTDGQHAAVLGTPRENAE